MKRVILLGVLLTAVVSSNAAARSLDFIVLLDVSESMLPYYDDAVHYLIGDLLTEHLQYGDTFYLLSFAGTPEFEISRKIESEQDVQAVLARLFLLQPLGRYTDLVAALKFLYTYTKSLPSDIPKRILILTDGIDDPPPGSPYPLDSDYRKVLDQVAAEIRKEGWQVTLMEIPSGSKTNLSSLGTAGLAQSVKTPQSEAAQAGSSAGQGASASSSGVTKEAGSIAGGGGAVVTAAPKSTQLPTVTAEAGSASGAAAGSSAGSQTGGQGGAVSATTTQGGTAQPAGGEMTTGQEKSSAGAPEQTTAATSSTTPSPSQAESATVTPAVTAKAGSASGATAGSSVGSQTGEQGGAGSAATAAGESKPNLYPALSGKLGVNVVPFQEPNSETNHLAFGAPELVFPADLGRVGRSFVIPFQIRNLNSESVVARMSGIYWNGSNILDKPTSLHIPARSEKQLRARVTLPAQIEAGSRTLDLTVTFSDDLRIYPREGSIHVDIRPAAVRASSSVAVLPILAYIGIGILGLALLAGIVLGLRRIVEKRIYAAVTPSAGRGALEAANAIEMIVDGQNSKIGVRNIHAVPEGGSRSIGGGISAFLVYLYPIPAHVAEIRRRDGKYFFNPLNEKYNAEGATIYDCLGRPISLVTDSGKSLSITFRRYVSPLEQINQIMHLTDRPGKPGNRPA